MTVESRNSTDLVQSSSSPPDDDDDKNDNDSDSAIMPTDDDDMPTWERMVSFDIDVDRILNSKRRLGLLIFPYFLLLDIILLSRHVGDIPSRDLMVAKYGALGLVTALIFLRGSESGNIHQLQQKQIVQKEQGKEGEEEPEEDQEQSDDDDQVEWDVALEESGSGTNSVNVAKWKMQVVFRILSVLEIIFTIAIPWAIVVIEWLLMDYTTVYTTTVDSRSNNIDSKRTFEVMEGKMFQHASLLVSHLFIFQTQIVFEALIMLVLGDGKRRKSGRQCKEWMMVVFTSLSNIYRLFPLVEWIQGAHLQYDHNNIFMVSEGDQHRNYQIHGGYQQGTNSDMNENSLPISFGAKCQDLILLLLPIVATLLWMFSSFIFIPLLWIPVILKELRGYTAQVE